MPVLLQRPDRSARRSHGAETRAGLDIRFREPTAGVGLRHSCHERAGGIGRSGRDAVHTLGNGGTDDATPDAATASAVATGAATASADPSGAAQKYTHSGYRYVLGYGEGFFGIWDRQDPSAPTERFPRTDDGWRQAWLRFVAQEPNHVAVPDTGAGPMGGAPAASPATPQTQPDPSDSAVVQYTHTGTRYLLGYGRTFFGIWDRQNPTTPVERFPRTDDGWGQAWRRYTQIENNFSEVGA